MFKAKFIQLHARRTSLYRVYFVYSLLLCIIPSFVLTLLLVSHNTRSIISQYSRAQTSSLIESGSILDTTIQNAIHISEMPMFSSDIGRAMKTNYKTKYYQFARDTNSFVRQLEQANRVNPNLMTCIFVNKYGYYLEYGYYNAQHREQIEQRIDEWKQCALNSPRRIYIAPVQEVYYLGSLRTVIPIVKILYDPNTFDQIGLCYLEINFEKVLNSFQITTGSTGKLLIYSGNSLIYPFEVPSFTKESSVLTDAVKNAKMLAESHADGYAANCSENGRTYILNSYMNTSTGWCLVQVLDNTNLLKVTYDETIPEYIPAFLFCIVIAFLAAGIITARTSQPIRDVCHAVDKIAPDGSAAINLSLCHGITELEQMVSSFNGLNDRLKSSLMKNYEIQITEERARYQMLQFQINHHFLYNTLNVISSIAKIHHIPEVSTIAISLSEMLRYGIERFPVSTVKDELKQINEYLKIQNIRFPNRFEYSCSIPTNIMNFKMPVFIFQPLVENAVIHAFNEMESGCIIDLSCNIRDNCVYFYIADNGCGMEQDTLQRLNTDTQPSQYDITFPDGSIEHHTSLGIHNVRQRLISYFGSKSSISFESEPGVGTIITIYIPT